MRRRPGKRAFAFGRSTGDAPVAVPNALIDEIQSVPVVLAIAADLNKIAIMDGNATDRPPVVGGASIYPFCWSILLAAACPRAGRRDDHVPVARRGPGRSAAGPAPDQHALVATIFLGVPAHQNTRLKRTPGGLVRARSTDSTALRSAA